MRSRLTLPQAIGVMLFGLAFIAGGLFVEWASAEFPENLNASVWVVRATGLLGLFPGIWFVVGGLRGFLGHTSEPQTQTLTIASFVSVFLLIFAAVLGSITIFGDSSGFQGGLTGTALEARIVFGIGTLVVGLLAIVSCFAVVAGFIGKIRRGRGA